MDRPFVGRSISYHPPAVAITPDSVVPASSIATSTPLPAHVPPSASSLQVFIPLTLPLNVPQRSVSDAPPPPLPPKSPVRLVQPPQPAAISPLASPSSNPSPLSTPGREQIMKLPNGFIAIPQAAYSQLMSPSNSQQTIQLPPSNPAPSPLSTPGREMPPQPQIQSQPQPQPQMYQQLPTMPSTSAEAALLHATMVKAAIAAATEQIERSQSAASNQTSSTSSSMTIVPQALQAGGGGNPVGIERKPPPTLFALSNAATQQQQQYQAPTQPNPTYAMHSVNPPTRQLTLPEMVITDSDQQTTLPSIVPGYSTSSQPTIHHLVTDPNGAHRDVLSAGPASLPLSRYGTRGASHVPQPVVFTPPQHSKFIPTQEIPQQQQPPQQEYQPISTSLSSQSHETHSSIDSHKSSNDLSSEPLSVNRSDSSLALLAPLTKFPDPAFPRRPLVLSEHLARFRKSSATPTSPSSLWHETSDGQMIGKENGDGTTKRRRKAMGTMFRYGKGAAIKWVGKDGLLGEDETWTVQKWGLMFTVASVSIRRFDSIEEYWF